MTFPHLLLLALTALIGGTLNSVAGGGSFFTFPALIFTGIPPVAANATSTVALWPGSAASVGAYRRELAEQPRAMVIVLVATSLIGGILGAILLLHTPASIFENLIPYLLLLATVLFATSGYITKRLRLRAADKGGVTRSHLVGMGIAQIIIALYGGYFGGGIGILMLATLGLMGMENIHAMNALKTVLATCINGVAVVTFIIAGAVYWPEALVMIVMAIIGGYGGAFYARKINPKWVRIFVIAVGICLTIYFFVQK
ncbi:MAG TPA: sulfite exporter TauE/SafE family protein [Dictyobacter sp.]|nr:sulfite exporter TauE/SafE family protein [Dictyobacter sp.]